MNMQLAERYMPLAESMARRRGVALPRNITLDDLRSAAYFALVDAASKYDPDRGVPFHAYARLRISGGITDCFRQASYDSAEVADAECRSDRSPVETDDFFEFVRSAVGDRNGKMVRMYYVDGRSLKEAGAAIGVGEARASQILKSCHELIGMALSRKEKS